MNRNLLLVALSLFTWGVGEGFFLYFQPLYLQEWGADSVTIGAILGGVGVMLALTQIPTGLLTDKIGPRNLMLSSWIIGVISAWMMALAPSLTVFTIGLLIYGMTGFGVISMNVYITNFRGKLSVGRAITFASGMYNLGAVIGPIVGGTIADRLGFRTVYIMASCVFVVSTVIIFLTQRSEQTHPADHREQTPFQSFLKNPRMLVFIGMIFITIFALYLPQSFTPPYLQNQQEMSRSTIGLLCGIGSLGNAIATLVLGNISPYIGLFIGQLWVALFSALFLWSENTLWFGVGYFFLGGYRLFRALVLAEARTMVHPNQTGLLFGVIETSTALAIILAPVLAGVLYEAQPTLMYKVALIIIPIMMVVNLLFLRTKRSHTDGFLNREKT
jgi:MFS family permease